MTGEEFLESIVAKAKAAGKTIVMPETGCQRIIAAAAEIEKQGIARVVMPQDIEKQPDFEEFVQTYHDLRKEKGVSLDQARATMADPNFYATMMVYKGKADGMVSGAEHTTADTIRPALQFIKTKPGYSVVSGLFFVQVRERFYALADCAVNPAPTPQQLAEIAVCSARSAMAFGLPAETALLSYSTRGSAKGPMVEAVETATKLARELAPDLPIDGPMQFDAAFDPTTAALKAPDSAVAGRATVMVFPDLNAGNICCKAMQRCGGGLALGPLLQGLKKPVNDLSRGALVADIVNTVALTAIQATIN
ncbi:hypothetical protein FACS1894186_7550 [Alphaproteobacteria bacterium]|nr:hypothetical protein FACS1894186_7550 [Alphaproteobacteria bacterium]